MLVFNTKFEQRFSFATDANKPLNSFPISTEKLLSKFSEKKVINFFIVLNNEVVEVSGATIHPTSDKERITPVKGYYLVGRKWDNLLIEDLENVTQSRITLSVNRPKIDSIGLKKKFQLTNTKEFKDIYEETIALLVCEYPVDFARELSIRNDRRFILLGGLGFLFFITVFLIFWLLLFKPLMKISDSLEKNDPSILNGFLNKKCEYGQLSNLIKRFFEQKESLKTEIAERKAIDKQIKKLSVVTEQSPVSIIITNLKGEIEYVNPHFTKLTGYTLSEVAGKNPGFMKWGDKTLAEYKELWATIAKGEIWEGEFKNRKKNGEAYYESAKIAPIYDQNGEKINFLAVKENITDKKLADLQNKAIFDIAKASTEVNNLNDLTEIIKLSLSEVIDIKNFYIALYDAEKDEFTIPAYADQKDSIIKFAAGKSLTAWVLRNKKPFLGTWREIDDLLKTGEIVSIGEKAKVWLGVPLIDNDEAFGVFAVQSYDNESDLTIKDRDILEFTSREISHFILKKKADDDIRIALKRAEESDRLKSAFLANMSHEIRTPLNSIMGFSELLVDPEIGQSEKSEFNSIIKTSGHQLLSIINDILDISMIEAGQLKINKTLITVEDFIEGLAVEYSLLFLEKHLEFKIDYPVSKSKTMIGTDKNRLTQILSSILNNALKFTQKGGIEIGFTKGSSGILFFVKDTGIGIPDEFKEHVFERFQQAEKNKTRNYGGNGLGLAISKSLTEALGGKIWFESRTGKGTTFYVLLPDV
jgi:PAS domain S-box-containing protein